MAGTTDWISLATEGGNSGTDTASAMFAMYLAVKQKKEAEELAKTPRPDYQIPEALQQSLAIANAEANRTELPGQTRMEEQLGQQMSSAVSQANEVADSPAAILGSISNIYGKQADSLNDLTISAANYRANQLKNLQGQLGLMSEEQKAQWEWNKQLPYLNAMQTAAALKGAAQQNVQTAITDQGAAFYSLKDSAANLSQNAYQPASQEVSLTQQENANKQPYGTYNVNAGVPYNPNGYVAPYSPEYYDKMRYSTGGTYDMPNTQPDNLVYSQPYGSPNNPQQKSYKDMMDYLAMMQGINNYSLQA